MRKITRKYLEQFLTRHASIERTLDIGAGGSSYGRFFPNRISIDIDPARKPDIVADAQALPFADAEFSSILCTEVLEHIRDPRLAVAEMRRVLQPNGKLILTTRFVYPLHDTPHDYWRFTKYGLEELFSDWNITELIPETIDSETIGVLLQRIGFQTRMWANVLSKLSIFALANIAFVGNRFITKRFGDVGKKQLEDHIMASGYYLIATPTKSPTSRIE